MLAKSLLYVHLPLLKYTELVLQFTLKLLADE